MADHETAHWWYRAQRANLVDAVRNLPLAPGARVLDAGCGTGRNLRELSRILNVTTHGIDASAEAAASWNGDGRRCRASVNELPYAGESFSVVASVDLLQEASVKPDRAIREMARVLRVGGFLVVLAPAYQWMLSRHDVAVDSVRRFTRRQLHDLALRAGLTVQRSTHRFATLFPLVASARMLGKLGGTNGGAVRSDLRSYPRWVNGTLHAIACIEHRVAGQHAIPFGSTILMIARKGTA